MLERRETRHRRRLGWEAVGRSASRTRLEALGKSGVNEIDSPDFVAPVIDRELDRLVLSRLRSQHEP